MAVFNEASNSNVDNEAVGVNPQLQDFSTDHPAVSARTWASGVLGYISLLRTWGPPKLDADADAVNKRLSTSDIDTDAYSSAIAH